MESLGDWRSSGVLLHVPLVKWAIPEKLVPQSELICRRLFQSFSSWSRRAGMPSLYRTFYHSGLFRSVLEHIKNRGSSDAHSVPFQLFRLAELPQHQEEPPA